MNNFSLENRLSDDEVAVLKNFEKIVDEKYSDRVFSTLTPTFIYDGKDYEIDIYSNSFDLLSLGGPYLCSQYVGLFIQEIVETSSTLVFYQFAETLSNERILRYKAV